MILEKLIIRRLPGIETPFETPTLSPGFNVIVGPNGIGKTSLRRAVAALLWPETEPSSLVDVAATWRWGRQRWTAERLGKDVVWTRDGVTSDPPELPPREHAHCYTIAFEDLSEDNLDDAALVEWIVKQMAGGYDLGQVLAEPPFELGARHGQVARRELVRHRADLERAITRQRRLETRRDELPRLEQERDAALAAREEITRLERWIEGRRWSDQVAKIDQELASLPPELAQLRGDELDRVREESLRLDTLARQEQELARELEALDRSLSRRRPPTSDALREANEWLERHEELVARAADLGRERDKLLAKLGGVAAPRENRFDDAEWVALEALLRRGDELRETESRLASEAALLADDDELDTPEFAASVDQYEAAIRTLRRWLSTEPSRRAFLAGLPLSLAWIGGCLSIEFAWSPIVAAGALPALIGLARDLMVRPEVTRAELERRYEETGLPTPDRWTAGEVAEQLETLEAIWEGSRDRQRQRTERERLEQRGRLARSEREEWERERQRLGTHLGTGTSTSALGLWAVAREWVAAEEWRDELRAIESDLARVEDEAGRLGRQLARVLGSTDDESGSTPSWRVRLARAKEARDDVDADEARRRALVERKREREVEREERTARVRELYARAGLERADELALARRIEALARYRELQQERHTLEWNARERREELERLDAPLPIDIASAERALESARERAARYAEWVSRITELESEVARTAEEGELSRLLAQVDRDRTRLDLQRDEALFAASGAWLLEQAAAQHRQRSQPRVFRRASAMFGLFTRFRFELVLTEQGLGREPTWFRARDTEVGTLHELGELSSGTRTQLLLAVRLAFALEADARHVLPLFLDEVMSHSDPDRRLALADNLIQLVKVEERQIFYLTCQPNDAAQLETLLQRARIDSATVDLAALREVAAAPKWGRAMIPEPPRVPEPEDSTWEAFADAARVPPLDLPRGLDAQHVLYLAPSDLDLVRRLLSLGLTHIGPARSLLASPGVSVYLQEDERLRLERRLRLADVFVELWGEGRPARLDPERLDRLGVSDRYRGALGEIASEVEWDAEQVAFVLAAREDERLKGLRSRETLIDRLREEGWVDDRPRLDRETLLARALARLAPDVEADEYSADEVTESIGTWWQLASDSETLSGSGAPPRPEASSHVEEELRSEIES